MDEVDEVDVMDGADGGFSAVPSELRILAMRPGTEDAGLLSEVPSEPCVKARGAGNRISHLRFWDFRRDGWIYPFPGQTIYEFAG